MKNLLRRSWFTPLEIGCQDGQTLKKPDVWLLSGVFLGILQELEVSKGGASDIHSRPGHMTTPLPVEGYLKE